MALRYVAVVALCALAGCGGATAPRASGPTLYLAGDNELWIVDADSGRVRHEYRADLVPGIAPHRVLARGSQVLVGAPYGTRAFFLPSARADRVWVVDLRRDGTVLGVREVTVDGETTVPATEPPSPRRPLGAVREGLLLEGDESVIVWDAVTDRIVRRLPMIPSQLGPASGDVVTMCKDAYCSVLRLIDLATGARRQARAPRGLTPDPFDGAFSPDGRTLAVPVRERGEPQSARRQLALIDVATGRLAVVPGSAVPAGVTLVAWAADGRHVFITGGKRGERRVIVGYRLGTRSAQVIDADVGDFYDAAAI
jgi:hypothetical protein